MLAGTSEKRIRSRLDLKPLREAWNEKHERGGTGLMIKALISGQDGALLNINLTMKNNKPYNGPSNKLH